MSTVLHEESVTRTFNRLNRCINCSFLIPRNQHVHTLDSASTNMMNLLQSWITPTLLSSESIICMECFELLQTQVNTIGDGNALPLPAFGHRSVCIPCGNSILRARRTYPVRHGRQERNILMRLVPLHLVSKLERVCAACWRSATRQVQRQQQHDLNHPSLDNAGSSMDVKRINVPLHYCILFALAEKM